MTKHSIKTFHFHQPHVKRVPYARNAGPLYFRFINKMKDENIRTNGGGIKRKMPTTFTLF